MKQKISKILFCVLAFIVIGLQTSHAQVKGTVKTFVEKDIVYWDYHSITIGDDYTIYVHVPPGYDTTGVKYPTLYITDGDWDKNVAVNSFYMLKQDYITQEAVVVGIGYGERPNKRDRDLEPKKGGPNFLAFIEKEVIPFIESKYRVKDDRTLSGYSYGGAFATYVLLHRPGLFNTICIGAPSFNNEMVDSAKKFFATNRDLKARVYLCVGSYEKETAKNILLFKDYLLSQHCKDLEVETGIIPNASHGAAKPMTIQNGIEFAYCKKHKAITLSDDELNKFSGNYVNPGNSHQKVRFYVIDNLLHADVGQTLELHPFAKNGFFLVEDESAELTFKEEGGKMVAFYTPYGQKAIRFDRVD